MFGTNVNEMNIDTIDLSNELRQGVEARLDLAPVVLCRPIARQLLSGREPNALRVIRYLFLVRPLGCVDAPAQVDECVFRKIAEKGRIASALVSICETPCFDAWASASPAETRSAGNTLAAPAAVDAAKKSRRVGGADFVGMTTLLGASEFGRWSSWPDALSWPGSAPLFAQ